MGAECVKSSAKQATMTNESKMGSLQYQLRNCEGNLLFTMTIQHLRLTNMTEVRFFLSKKVKQIRFSLENQFQLFYTLSEFTIQENLIKSQKIHKTHFQFPVKKINSKFVIIQIIGFKNEVIETVKLKLIHLCTGPVHHDHLLKQLRARLMFDLHLFQNINVSAKSKDFKIKILEPKLLKAEGLTYKFTLTVINFINQTQMDEKTFESNQSELANYDYFQDQQLSLSVPNNILKESNFRFQIFSRQSQNETMDNGRKVIHSIFIPYRRIQSHQIYSTQKKNNADYHKKTLSFHEPIKVQGQIVANISFLFEVQTSILYLQQMECLIMSEIGIGYVSPTSSCLKSDELWQEIQQIYKNIKNIKNSLTDMRSSIIKLLDQIHTRLLQYHQVKFSSEQELYKRQMMLVKFLNELSSAFVEGDDLLNQKIWRTINCIAHKPELSARYLTLHKSLQTRKQIYLLYYKFITAVLSKVIAYTELGITFNELQCIQKFIAFSYFRFPWIQDKIIEALSRKQDPFVTEEKLIQYGANAGCKSPSKSYVYDWEDKIYRLIHQDKQMKDITSKLQTISQKFEGWDRLLFNRQDEDLFYGLFLQIWTEAEAILSNYRGKILWEYFPNYGKLLGCFLGQMNNSKITDFSELFKQCSQKLVLNQKLLNTFVVQLFPKTCLFEISCVLKCLGLLQSYFQVLTKQNKKLPHDFHFNFFYTGIKSIFEQNHSYLIVKALQIVYKHYEIFTQEFKKILNSFLLSNIFFSLFLHWCSNVRQMFHHLIYHKLIQNRISNPEEIQGSMNKSSQQKKEKQKVISDQSLINRKINFYLRAIENLSDQIRRNQCKDIQRHKYKYHEKMRLKIQEKRRKINNEKEMMQDFLTSKISEDAKSCLFINRKNSLFAQKNENEFSRLRKLSVADQQDFPRIEEKFKKYCLVSLKEYQEVKRNKKPLNEVKKLTKIVQGSIEI